MFDNIIIKHLNRVDALNTNDEVKFGDGDFSGGGAGGSWDNDSNTENFS